MDVPERHYVDAMLAFHELGDIAPLRELFVFACERSAQRHAAVRQSLGEPDPFRMRHRAALVAFADERVPAAERERFVEMAESELLGLHDGNYARHRVRASEFAAWHERWQSTR